MPEGDAPRYEFLSEDWLAAVAELRSQRTEPEGGALKVAVNLVVTEVPFSPGRDLHAHVDTTTGALVIDAGHVPHADLSITVAWATAKALLIEGDQQAAMGAFLEGRVRVEGDVGKLLAFQSGVVDESTHEAARAIRAFTA